MTVYRTVHGNHFHRESCPFIQGKQYMPCSTRDLHPCQYCCKDYDTDTTTSSSQTQFNTENSTFAYDMPSSKSLLKPVLDAIFKSEEDRHEERNKKLRDEHEEARNKRLQNYTMSDAELKKIASEIICIDGQIPIATSIAELKRLPREEQVKMYYAVLWKHNLYTKDSEYHPDNNLVFRGCNIGNFEVKPYNPLENHIGDNLTDVEKYLICALRPDERQMSVQELQIVFDETAALIYKAFPRYIQPYHSKEDVTKYLNTIAFQELLLYFQHTSNPLEAAGTTGLQRDPPRPEITACTDIQQPVLVLLHELMHALTVKVLTHNPSVRLRFATGFQIEAESQEQYDQRLRDEDPPLISLKRQKSLKEREIFNEVATNRMVRYLVRGTIYDEDFHDGYELASDIMSPVFDSMPDSKFIEYYQTNNWNAFKGDIEKILTRRLGEPVSFARIPVLLDIGFNSKYFNDGKIVSRRVDQPGALEELDNWRTRIFG